MRTRFYALIVAVGGLTLAAAGTNPGSRAADAADAAANVETAAVAATGAAVGTDATATPTAAKAAPSPAEVRRTQVDGALEQLEAEVPRQSAEGALRAAFQAYFNYQAAHPEDVKNPYLYFVDYGLDNRTPRGYVFNMEQLTLVEGPFIVAHGRGSSASKNAVPTRFTNIEGSATTSLGLYVTQEQYGFSGKSAGRYYTSVGLRMKGVSGEFNDAARERRVVIHGAPYVTASGAGRSEGCPAMEQSRARRLLPLLADGALVFLYSPNHDEWVETDRWATAEY